MWIILAFVSALTLGGYDISKKIALQHHRVMDVLTLSILLSSFILCVPLILSRTCPEMMTGTLFFVPQMDLQAHIFTFVKSCIVLSSWIFAYVSLKYLPMSVVTPMQATRPMWTLVGALLIFGERLNIWQWVGVLLAIGSIFVFSFRNHPHVNLHEGVKSQISNNKYYICLALAIIIGSCSALYDKFLMHRYDHNFVQVWYTLYQAILMLLIWSWDHFRQRKKNHLSPFIHKSPFKGDLEGLFHFSILLISLFLVISDNTYMLALRDPDSLIAVVSTVRRGGAVIGFAYGLLFLHEPEPRKKILCMLGVMLGLICLALGSV